MWRKAFEYLQPENVKITIIAEWAGEIPFSQKTITTSMQKIHKACGAKVGKSGELYEWLHRGILLISYSEDIDVNYLNTLAGPVYLWGKRACELQFTKETKRNIKHPQNSGPWDFIFDENICWDILPTIVCATDGACKGNGTKWAYGGYACVFDDSRFENIGASMQPYTYSSEGWTNKYTPITNIRSEMLAIYIALKTVYDKFEEVDLTIITDNMYCYELFEGKKYFELWGDSYLQKKNPDLLTLLRPYIGKFTIIHQPAHLKDPRTKFEIMNSKADELANKWCIKK